MVGLIEKIYEIVECSSGNFEIIIGEFMLKKHVNAELKADVVAHYNVKLKNQSVKMENAG
jgi:hypothetical protein